MNTHRERLHAIAGQYMQAMRRIDDQCIAAGGGVFPAKKYWEQREKIEQQHTDALRREGA